MSKIKLSADLDDRNNRSGHIEMTQNNVSSGELMNLVVKFARSLGFLDVAIYEAMLNEVAYMKEAQGINSRPEFADEERVAALLLKKTEVLVQTVEKRARENTRKGGASTR